MRQTESMPKYNIFIVEIGMRVGFDPGWNALRGFAGGLRDVAACGMDLVVVVCCEVVLAVSFFMRSQVGDLHFVTCTACLAKPARFHTRLPSFGSNCGTSLLTSLYDTGFLLYALILFVFAISQVRLVFPS